MDTNSTQGAFIDSGKYRLKNWAKKDWFFSRNEVHKWIRGTNEETKLEIAKKFWATSFKEVMYSQNKDNNWRVVDKPGRKTATKPTNKRPAAQKTYGHPKRPRLNDVETFDKLLSDVEKEDFVLPSTNDFDELIFGEHQTGINFDETQDIFSQGAVNSNDFEQQFSNQQFEEPTVFDLDEEADVTDFLKEMDDTISQQDSFPFRRKKTARRKKDESKSNGNHPKAARLKRVSSTGSKLETILEDPSDRNSDADVSNFH